MIKLGDKVKDTISGFEGVAISRHSYLQGCDRISVQPPVDNEGKLPDTASFDEPQLTVVVPQIVSKVEEAPNGGPERYMPTKKGTG